MGNYLSLRANSDRGLKRSRSSLELDDNTTEEDRNLHTPKKRKLKSTTQYIYETLFVNGESSDITVNALGYSWQLHKVYLCQSGYFNSMFRKNWRESQQSVINMDIVDENIDKEALDVTFGSLYRDEIDVTPSDVIGVLAAAIQFSLCQTKSKYLCPRMEDLIHQCVSIMIENISSQTVCFYYYAGVLYGQTLLTGACVSWLKHNLLLQQSADLLRDISVELMSELIGSDDVVVIQVEMDLYSLLRKWLFLHLSSTQWSGTLSELNKATECFIKSRAPEWKSSEHGSLLASPHGQQFIGAFKALRLNHVMVDYSSVAILEGDGIIPQDWLQTVYRSMFLTILKADNASETGPSLADQVHFDTCAFRCGRVIQKQGDLCWRWTGYNYGVDLLMSFTGRVLKLKRNTLSHASNGAVSLAVERKLLYRLEVMSFDNKGHVKYSQQTELKEIALKKDEETVVLILDRNLCYPFHVSCRFLSYTPLQLTVSPGTKPTSLPVSV